MADKTGIEWADATWNPIVGCSLVSPGCTNCYAMGLAARIEAMQPGSHYAGTTMRTKAGAVWTGKLAPAPANILTQPLRWRRPREVFVNSMGDLFHKDASRVLVDRAFAVMATANHHTYLVLTKRPDYMREYATATDFTDRVADAQVDLGQDSYANQPERHIFLGASVEDQHRADDRRPHMAALAAAGWRTFVSYEPALGPVDWSGWEFLSGLISGGESGPRARPTHPDWHRATRDFCAAKGIPYFFKQWGAWQVAIDREAEDPDWRAGYSREFCDSKPGIQWLNLAGGRGFHGERFHVMRRVGKARAGRLLDGREHNALPWRAA